MNNTSSTFFRMFTIAKHYIQFYKYSKWSLLIHGEYKYIKFSLLIHGEYSLNPMLSLPIYSTKFSIPHFSLKYISREKFNL